MKKLILIILVYGSLMIQGSTGAANPNVLFILIDDFGWRDVGYNGSTFYETPVMDRLSKEWMRFDSCYTPSPMCSPTRASILTGKNPARHGITQWLSGRDSFHGRKGEKPKVYCPKPLVQGIKDSEVTLGEAFQEAGYETAFYGKWHMGKLKATGGPANHGYESQVAVIEENGCKQFSFKRHIPDAKPGQSFNDALTDKAIEFVTTERDKPFYLHLCHFAMHAKIETSPELRVRFEAKKKRLGIGESKTALDDYSHQPHKLRQDSAEYTGELFNLDGGIGRLIDALKECEQYENTIIILTGDNGGRSTINKPDATSIMPIRGGKTFLFDGGLRTPLLIRWPGHSAAGMNSEVLVSSMDFYPTLLEMAGLPLKPRQHRDGVSLAPLFNNGKLERDTFYWHFPHYQGEGSYPASAIRVGDYKLIQNYHHGDVLLYNVKEDISESRNLAADMPEKVQLMQQRLMKYLKETGASIPRPVRDDDVF
ncbi:sulfatase [Pontiellaceae bacterium B12227]|nr:sulfatase [Pontiellaceae bacterium B12227]